MPCAKASGRAYVPVKIELELIIAPMLNRIDWAEPEMMRAIMDTLLAHADIKTIDILLGVIHEERERRRERRPKLPWLQDGSQTQI